MLRTRNLLHFQTAAFSTVLFLAVIGLFNVSHLSQVNAQTANSFYFEPASVSVAPTGTLTLRANVGSNVVNFAGASFQIDITKVRVSETSGISYPLTVNNRLYLVVPATSAAYVNCAPVAGNPATAGCSNGLIRFALAEYPQTAPTPTNTPQSGIFTLAQIPLNSVNDTAAISVNTIFSATANEFVVKSTGNDLTPYTTNPATITVPLRGDAGGDGHVTLADYMIWQGTYSQTVTGGASAGDYNGDGRVSLADYMIWQGNYGK